MMICGSELRFFLHREISPGSLFAQQSVELGLLDQKSDNWVLHATGSACRKANRPPVPEFRPPLLWPRTSHPPFGDRRA